MKLKPKFELGDVVTIITGDEELIVQRYQICFDKRITYGCLKPTGDLVWCEAYEIKLITSDSKCEICLEF